MSAFVAYTNDLTGSETAKTALESALATLLAEEDTARIRVHLDPKSSDIDCRGLKDARVILALYGEIDAFKAAPDTYSGITRH